MDIEMELLKMRLDGEADEAKHDCKGCKRRVGIPCNRLKKEIKLNEDSTR